MSLRIGMVSSLASDVSCITAINPLPREVRVSTGVKFLVAICDDIMTLPGLLQKQAAISIKVDDSGNIVALF